MQNLKKGYKWTYLQNWNRATDIEGKLMVIKPMANLQIKLEEAQAGIEIAGRNINNLRYVDDTSLMAESEEELKSLFMKVKEESEKS